MTEATNQSSLPVSAGPTADSSRPYSSVSYLAIGGILLAIAYAAVMTIGVVIALFNRTPWILPAWSFIFPLGAALVCWAARVRIHNSEDSLTGASLTAWGLWLTLSFGLVYGAYYSACYLWVTQTATTFADGWFDDLKNDRLDLAFLKSLPPPRPAADAQLRDRLELDHNSGPEGKGPFTDFRQSHLVRQMEQGGPADQVQFLGVQSWGYDQGGYQVQVLYRVTTPTMTSEVLATVFGVDNAEDSGARQWYIKNLQPNLQPSMSDDGRRMTQLSGDAQSFAQAWLEEVTSWDWDKAYLDTLPPAEREKQAAELKRPLKDRSKAFQEGEKAFRDGNVVRADPGVFWASPKEKDKIINGVRGIFGKGKTPEGLSLQPNMPIYHRDGERVTLRFDLMIPLPPMYGVQSQIVVTADARNGDPTAADWRVEALELISGKSLTAGAPGPGGTSARMPRPPR
jgi:hypothetical protein